MYIRFVILRKDDDSHRCLGVYQAADELIDSGVLTDQELRWLKDQQRWFNKRLDVPSRFSRSTRPGAHNNAISWFKDTAGEYIEKMRELVKFLEQHGLRTKMLQTDRPGYIVYEDEHQIAAVPFKDTQA